MTNIKKNNNSQCCKDMEHLELSCSVVQHLEDLFGSFLES